MSSKGRGGGVLQGLSGHYYLLKGPFFVATFPNVNYGYWNKCAYIGCDQKNTARWNYVTVTIPTIQDSGEISSFHS